VCSAQLLATYAPPQVSALTSPSRTAHNNPCCAERIVAEVRCDPSTTPADLSPKQVG